MSKFNNATYEALVKDLIKDAFYIESSKRGTISKIRQYSEVIVRRILDLSSEDYVTLGNKEILGKIKKKSNNNKFLLDALKTINEIGNKCTHTQYVGEVSEKDIDDVIDSLFKLYSYLLISYFEKYRFGSNMKIVSSFSILPPIIRFITLEYLNSKYPEDIIIIDKLTLAILKAFDKEKALNWIEERKKILMNTQSISKEVEQNIKEKLGEEFAMEVVSNQPNMYNLCMERIQAVGKIIEEKGRLYDDFESAIDIYKEKGIVEGETPDVLEFNSIMEFLYLGRKSQGNESLKEKFSYLTIMDNTIPE